MMDPYVIWSFEHRGWWRPERRGYTRDLGEAGRFARTDAETIVASANIVAIEETAMTLSDAMLRPPLSPHEIDLLRRYATLSPSRQMLVDELLREFAG